MTKDNRINWINMGLMLLSCLVAFIVPFELFLLVYAVLGPLHYLTEISWLHDRQYFTKGKYDYLILLIITMVITLIAYGPEWFGAMGIKVDFSFFGDGFGEKLTFLALAGSLLLIFIKNIWIKSIGLLFIFILANMLFEPGKNDNLAFFVGTLVPTLIHVYIFTMLFMLFGALKSRSKTGLLSIVVLVICPLLLFFLFPGRLFVEVSQYGRDSYIANGNGFFDNNLSFLTELFHVKVPFVQTVSGEDSVFTKDGVQYTIQAIKPSDRGFSHTADLVFHSEAGILLMRFIAFAYTYHYLNWFSKTEIIRWHKVPKLRFVAVIVLWIISLVIYAIDYSLGLQVLFFLSFSHVFLEFPLNMTSIVGIGKEMLLISRNGFKPVSPKT
jgi:hypothetical protein